MHDFTPISALVGGGLIGIAASILLIASGRIAGISGIVSGVLQRTRGDVLWRALFVLGLLIAGGAAALWAPERIGASPRSLPTLLAAGFIVGVGTRLGNGCTSGHGVCGISRFSVRSILATVTFIAAGMISVRVITWLGGGS